MRPRDWTEGVHQGRYEACHHDSAAAATWGTDASAAGAAELRNGGGIQCDAGPAVRADRLLRGRAAPGSGGRRRGESFRWGRDAQWRCSRGLRPAEEYAASLPTIRLLPAGGAAGCSARACPRGPSCRPCSCSLLRGRGSPARSESARRLPPLIAAEIVSVLPAAGLTAGYFATAGLSWHCRTGPGPWPWTLLRAGGRGPLHTGGREVDKGGNGQCRQASGSPSRPQCSWWRARSNR